MKERPILFSAPMVRAILDGSKTQTRRIVKLPHQNPLGQWEPTTIGGETGGSTIEGNAIPLQGAIWHTRTGDCLIGLYGQPGDRLWVRETFFAWGRWETRFSTKKGRDEWHFIDMTEECAKDYLYAADGVSDTQMFIKRRGSVTPMYWKRPAIHMPRAASRLLLNEAGVRVERLQDISEQDARAEGVCELPLQAAERGAWWTADASAGAALHGRTPTAAYRLLWESINGAGSWDANPWVWVIEFKRITAALKQSA